jgi:hypothetical protein
MSYRGWFDKSILDRENGVMLDRIVAVDYLLCRDMKDTQLADRPHSPAGIQEIDWCSPGSETDPTAIKYD